MRERMIADAKKVGADTVLYRTYDGTTWEYRGHILVVYFLLGTQEIAHYAPADLAGFYMGKGYPKLHLYSRKWGMEAISQYANIPVAQ